jgi:steroid Delta-isomerase
MDHCMPATPQQVRQALEAYVRAWATNDRELFLSLFAEDARWSDPVGTPEFRGHRGIAKFWNFSHQDPERILQPRVEEIRACANEGILRFTMQVRIPRRNEGLDLSVIDYVVVNEAGKIEIARAFWDESNATVPAGMKAFAADVSQAYES